MWHLGWSNPRYGYKLREELSENSPAEKDLLFLVNEKVDICKKCTLISWKAIGILGFVKRGVASRVRNGIVPLCSVLMRHHLE